MLGSFFTHIDLDQEEDYVLEKFPSIFDNIPPPFSLMDEEEASKV